jgi:methyl acetate hydrolase
MMCSRIDEALRSASDARVVAGVVAMATTGRKLIYEGAVGRRDLSRTAPMTLDTVFLLASMTKTLTSTAALQLVEQEKLGLDRPIGEVVRELADVPVLEGFDGNGKPRLRPAKRPITLRHLLTHTSGFGHEVWNADVGRYQAATGTPLGSSGTNASLRLPLLFDPGERWEYGISIEWVGKAVEAASGKTLGQYFRDHLTGPLGMRDTNFGVAPQQRSRLATVHRRDADGAIHPIDMEVQTSEYEAGGGGLYSTAEDYVTFLRMLLNRGDHVGHRILRPKTAALMVQNHIGDIPVTEMKTMIPDVSNDFELFPGMLKKWSLAGLINTVRGPNGRSAGSLAWGGVANTYFWLDSSRRVAGVFMTQVMPFGDRQTLDLFGQFERELYGALP